MVEGSEMITMSVVESSMEAVAESSSVETSLATVDVDALDIHVLNANVLRANTFASISVSMLVTVSMSVMLVDVVLMATELLVLNSNFFGNHNFTSVTSLSLENDLLVKDGFLDKPFAMMVVRSLMARFFVNASLNNFFLNDLNNLLTDDAKLTLGNSTFNDPALDNLDDFDLALDYLRFRARLSLEDFTSGDLNHFNLALDHFRFRTGFSLEDFTSSDLNKLDFAANAPLHVASFLVVTFRTDFSDRNAFLDGNNAVRFMEWRKDARFRLAPAKMTIVTIEQSNGSRRSDQK